MSDPKYIIIKESLDDLLVLKEGLSKNVKKRIEMLIYIKEKGNLSKQKLASAINVSHTSIQNWRIIYEKSGLDVLIKHKTYSKASAITPNMHEFINNWLHGNVIDVLRYRDLQKSIKAEFDVIINYQTLAGYINRRFKLDKNKFIGLKKVNNQYIKSNNGIGATDYQYN